VQNDAGPTQSEINLRLTKDARKALEHHPAFVSPRASLPEERRRVATYFDTSDLALHHKGLSLRIQRCGEQRVLIVKAARGRDAIAERRNEWELPVEGDAPDLSHLHAAPIARVMQALHGASLQPVFEIDVRRIVRLLNCDRHAVIEAVIDEGSLTAEGRSIPISEMDLELKAGGVASLYRLALGLITTVPLSLETQTKDERGLRLRFDKPPEASKAPSLAIEVGASSAEAFRHIVNSGLGYMLANVAAAEIGDLEGVHQIRVAIRHLRAALRLFRPLLQSDTLDRFNGELRRYGTVIGKARDWDVFVLETLPAVGTDWPGAGGTDTLRRAAQPMRTDAHHDVAKAVRGPAFTRLVLGLASWVEDGVCSPGSLGAAMTKPVGETAPALLIACSRKSSLSHAISGVRRRHACTTCAKP
jgi:triphosphatase